MKITKEDFDILSVEDELRADALCRDLLMEFYNDLTKTLPEAEATAIANSADYFLRDFVIGMMQKNFLDKDLNLVRQFAGNWYIVNRIEPAMEELSSLLSGIMEFYSFLHSAGFIDDEFFSKIKKECSDVEFYSSRIESFWNIKEDGYYEWERECSLK